MINSQTRPVFSLILVIFLAFLASNSYSDIQVKLSETKSKYILDPYVSYLEDREGVLTLDVARERYLQQHSSLKENFNNVLNFGLSRSTFWLFFSVVPDETLIKNDDSWVLEIPQPLLKSASIFVYHKGSLVFDREKYHAENDNANTRNVLFNIKSISEGRTDFIVKISSYSVAQFPLILWKPQALAESYSSSEYFLGLYFGVMGLTMFFIVVISFLTRDLSYFYYSGFIFSTLLFFTSYTGIGNKFFWGELSEFNNYIPVMSAILVMVFSIRFTSVFGIKEKPNQTLNLLINIFTLVSLIFLIASFVNPFGMITATLFLVIIYALFLSIIIFYSKYESAIELAIIVFSFVTLSISLTLFVSPLMLFTPITIFSEVSLYAGSTIQILSLSFAIANQINVERKKRNRAFVRESQAVQSMHKIEEGSFKKAMMDPLTRLPNRIALERFSDSFLDLKKGVGTPLAIALIHIPDYHQINNTLGFRSGDFLMEKVASRINRYAKSFTDCISLQFPDGDTYYTAKLDNASFVVLFKMKEKKQKYVEDTNHLLALLNKPITIYDMTLDIKAKAGMSFSPEHSTNIFTLVRFSQAVLESNNLSEATVLVYTSLVSQQATRKLKLINDLRKAIKNNEISLVYQPQLAVVSQKIVSLEALVRWNHKEYGQVAPSEFIILAEQTGFIDELSDWLIKKALNDILWLLERGFKLNCSINISAKSLSQEDFTKNLISLLESLSLSPNILTLELTELSLMTNPVNSARVIDELNKTGFHIAIDNFGVANSSLAYLKNLPLSEIKIDKSLITDIDKDSNDRIITKSIINLVHEMGAQVCAEGVETTSCLNILERFQCDKVQGFHIAKPLNKEDLVVWIDQRQFLSH